MKGAIPLSARSNTSGWQRRERKQNASIEQRLAKREGGTEADEIQAALRLICLLLSLKRSLIKEWRGLFAASYVVLLPGCRYFCLVCQRSGTASLLGQVLLRWIWKQINQAISGSRHFSLTLRVPAAPPLSRVSALLQDPFNLEQTKESGKKIQPGSLWPIFGCSPPLFFLLSSVTPHLYLI